jgi:hypothetical protein
MTMRTYDINQYALELRRSGKLLREIGEELGVGKVRERGSGLSCGARLLKKLCERDKNATTMGDLFLSARLKPMAAIKGIRGLTT